MSEDITLGVVVQDQVSGLVGVVVAIGEHITGCERYGVRPIADDGRAKSEEQFFYAEELTTVPVDTDEIPITDDGVFEPLEDAAEDATTDTDISLGDRVEDDISGVEGVVTTITYKLLNCPRVAVSATEQDDTSELNDRSWFDITRVTRINGGVAEEFTETVDTAAASATGPSGSDHQRKADSR